MLPEFSFRGQPPEPRRIRRGLRQLAYLLVLARSFRAVPRPVAVIIAVLWSACVGYLIILAGLLLLAPGVDYRAAISGQVWLAAHQAGISTSDGTITLLPLALTLLPIVLWRRSGRWLLARTSRKFAVSTSTVGYASLAVFVALVSGVPEIHVSPLFAFPAASLLVGVGWLWALRKEQSGTGSLPGAIAGGLVAVASVILVGSVTLAVGVLANFEAVQQVFVDEAVDITAAIGLLVVQVLYLPNFILWAAAYATGTGIAVGSSHTISPYESATPSFPDLPLSVVLLNEPGTISSVLPLLMIAAGGLAALATHRRSQVFGLRQRLSRAAILGGIVVLFWLAARPLAGGSLGEGNLDWVGPAAGTSLACGLLVGVGAAIWALMPTLAADARPVAADLKARFGPRSTQTSQPRPVPDRPPAHSRK